MKRLTEREILNMLIALVFGTLVALMAHLVASVDVWVLLLPSALVAFYLGFRLIRG